MAAADQTFTNSWFFYEGFGLTGNEKAEEASAKAKAKAEQKETKQQTLLKEAERFATEHNTKVDSINMPRHLQCRCRVTTECEACPEPGGNEMLEVCPLHERRSDYERSCDECVERRNAKSEPTTEDVSAAIITF